VRGGCKLGLVRIGADIVEKDPIFDQNDPSCCPTGGFVHGRRQGNGERFGVVRSWHDHRYRE